MKSFQKIIDDYKDVIKNEKRISCTGNLTIDDIFLKLKDSKTSFGSPKLLEVSFVKGKSIVIGPNIWGDYLIVYKYKSDFYVSVQQEVMFIKQYEEKEQDKTATSYDNPQTWFDNMFRSIDIYSLYEKVSDFVECFVKNGDATYVDHVYEQGNFYCLNESILPDSKNYLLTDINDRIVYDINNAISTEAFYIYDHLIGDEMLKVVRKWSSFNHRYEFYKNDNLYGIFEKESALSMRIFVMSSLDGEVTMRQCRSKAGIYYIVKVKDNIAGIIVDHIVSDIGDPELDTCIIQVRTERYKPLLAALATMIVRRGSSNE